MDVERLWFLAGFWPAVSPKTRSLGIFVAGPYFKATIICTSVAELTGKPATPTAART